MTAHHAHRVTWLGHATVLIETGGARLLTDPVLSDRVMHLKRRVPTPSRCSPNITVFVMTGNQSGQRSWSARTANTASGEAFVNADPENENGA